VTISNGKTPNNKIQSQAGLITSLKSTLDGTVSSLVQKVDTLSNNVEANKFKINNMDNILANKLEALSGVQNSSKSAQNTTSLLNLVEVETEVKNVREQLLSERAKREQEAEESQKLFYQLQQKIHSQEKEMMERLKEHRNDQLELFKSGEEERSKMVNLKNEKSEGDLEYVKNYIRTVERRLREGVGFWGVKF
jgi:chromosome segregation ATPase